MMHSGAAFVQFSGISLAFGERDILKKVSLNLSSSTKAALCGANGSGKTTLMKVLAGIIHADSGECSVSKNCRVSYLPQSGIIHTGNSLYSEVEHAFDTIQDMIGQADTYAAELEHAADDDAAKGKLNAWRRLTEAIDESGYYGRAREIERVLTGLGFSRTDFDKQCDTFSGGWQMRIALAKVLLEKPNIMLLDEPTNYLDIEARDFLETYLEKFDGGFLIVSHDRYFLDVTVNEVYEVFQGVLKRYQGNYSAYEKTRETEMDALVKAYNAEQEEMARLRTLIEKFRYKATKAAFAQEQIKKLKKLEKTAIILPPSSKKINLRFAEPPHSPRIALTLTNIAKAYGENRVLHNLSLTVESGSRLLVVGVNGAGKTTLLRILAGEDDDYTGERRLGTGITAAYFSQDSAEKVRGRESIISYMEGEAPTHLIPKLRDMLGAFLFSGDDVYKSLDVLSGGEKSRLALLHILLRPANLLILDEPTNHLDIVAKNILLDALAAYNGTVIFVSHDRSFMEALSTKTLELSIDERKEHHAALYYGNYAYYLEKTLHDTRVNIQRDTIQRDTIHASHATAYAAAYATAYISREEQKRREAEERRRAKREAELLAVIEGLEAERDALDAQLALPEVYRNGEAAREAQKKRDDVERSIEAATAEWEKLLVSPAYQ